MVFKTRTKQYSSNPFFEAPIEVFCRDFKDTVIRVVMRDSRLREAVSTTEGTTGDISLIERLNRRTPYLESSLSELLNYSRKLPASPARKYSSVGSGQNLPLLTRLDDLASVGLSLKVKDSASST